MANNENFDKQVLNPYPTGTQSYTAWEQGFISGYRSRLKSLPAATGEGWISVEDGLPNSDDFILLFTITSEGVKSIEYGYYDNKRFFDKEGNKFDNGSITHWRYLPLPPHQPVEPIK